MKMSETIPSELEWGDLHTDLDQRYAHDFYVGKTTAEMQEHFLTGPIEAFDEILFMPRVPFQYYVLGFRDSVLSRKHQDEFDMGSAAVSFLKLIEVRSENTPSDVHGILNELSQAIEYIAANTGVRLNIE